jgi:RNA polymerase sigma-70 factor (ECF subfamily)
VTARVLPLQRRPEPASERTDEQLVAACANGDAGGLAALFQRHHGPVLRFASRLAGHGGHEEDIAQRTFVEAWRAAGKFRGGSSVRSWLFGIAVNEARHQVRSQLRSGAMAERVAQLPATPSRGPDEELERVQQRGRLERALAELPHLQREAFVLCDVEQVKGREAAAALGIPEGTLWRRLFDARRALRAALEGDEP